MPSRSSYSLIGIELLEGFFPSTYIFVSNFPFFSPFSSRQSMKIPLNGYYTVYSAWVVCVVFAVYKLLYFYTYICVVNVQHPRTRRPQAENFTSVVHISRSCPISYLCSFNFSRCCFYSLLSIARISTNAVFK